MKCHLLLLLKENRSYNRSKEIMLDINLLFYVIIILVHLALSAHVYLVLKYKNVVCNNTKITSLDQFNICAAC